MAKSKILKHCQRRFKQLEDERSSWLPKWKDIVNNFSPTSGKFLVTDRNKGNKKSNLINNTPLFAVRTLVAGLMSGVTSPARPWFRLTAPDMRLEGLSPVREWINYVERLMYRVFTKSNLYQELPKLYTELCTIGTGCMLVEEDKESIAHFTTLTAGEFMLDVNAKGQVDTFSREYELSIKALVDEFGIDNVSSLAKTQYENGHFDNPIVIRHVIESNLVPPAIEDLDKSVFPYRSIYYESNEDRPLRIRGYREFPVMAPRWELTSGNIYGNSPARMALGDAKALQIQELEKGKAVAKMVSPPTKAPTSLRNEQVSLLPGSNVFVDDPNNVFTSIYQVNADVNHLMNDIARTEARIKTAFFVDLFLLISSSTQVRTATEINAREEEKLIALGTVLESLHTELLSPLIDRTFSIILNEAQLGWKGLAPMLLPLPPEELTDNELKVEYISTLGQAQKLLNTSSMERWIGFTSQMAQLDPSVLDIIDKDQVVREMAESLGVTTKVINSLDNIKAIRAGRAQQAQVQQDTMALQNAMGLAKEAAQITGNQAQTTSQQAITEALS